MPNRRSPEDGVLLQICLECGKQYMYEEEAPPAEQVCGKCGNRVFRSFFAVPRGDEAIQDFEDTTRRDLAPDDPATDVTRTDLLDLDNF